EFVAAVEDRHAGRQHQQRKRGARLLALLQGVAAVVPLVLVRGAAVGWTVRPSLVRRRDILSLAREQIVEREAVVHVVEVDRVPRRIAAVAAAEQIVRTRNARRDRRTCSGAVGGSDAILVLYLAQRIAVLSVPLAHAVRHVALLIALVV